MPSSSPPHCFFARASSMTSARVGHQRIRTPGSSTFYSTHTVILALRLRTWVMSWAMLTSLKPYRNSTAFAERLVEAKANRVQNHWGAFIARAKRQTGGGGPQRGPTDKRQTNHCEHG